MKKWCLALVSAICLISLASMMKSNLGGRNILTSISSEDIVEVEYLEAGEGGELIDTGVYCIKTNDVHIKIWTFSTYLYKYSETFCYATNGYYRIAVQRYAQSTWFWCGEMMYGLILCRDLLTDVPYEIDIHNEPSAVGDRYYPGTCYAMINGTEYSNGYAWDIPFVTEDTVKLFVDVSKGNRIYYFSIDNQIDLVPVRVGNVGYMYDRLDPTSGPYGNGLYGNIGSGFFVVGPDKK